MTPAKTANASTIRLLLADRQSESLISHIGGFRAYEPLEKDNTVDHDYVVYGGGDQVDDKVYVDTCESQASLTQW